MYAIFILQYNYLTDIFYVLWFFRKRKKDFAKDTGPESDPIVRERPVHKTKAKDSDDEDYMSWKKPDAIAPIVTFTPPPDDAAPAPVFRYKPNILTKKYLEFVNGRQNLNRPIFADGDDGFESLNGYNSNGSDGECRHKERELQNPPTKCKKRLEGSPKLISMLKDPKNLDDESVQGDNVSASVIENKDEEEKSVEPDSDCAITTTNPNVGKRIGVRFRKSWTKENIHHESSDDDFGSVKGKQKVKIHFKYKLDWI